ncbi:MAG: alpha/beta fold hydrolase [Candidatus Woesearchaeota archaeon]
MIFLISCTEKNDISQIEPKNLPFKLDGDSNIGVLLIHGFSASPNEVRELGEFLNKNANITVYAPLLSGHGTNYRDFGNHDSDDWKRGVQQTYDELRQEVDILFVGGISLGGNLALDIGKENDFDGIFIISPVIDFRNNNVKNACFIKYFVKSIPNKNVKDEVKKYYYYNRSVSAICNLYKYIEMSKIDLNRVDEPLMILQSQNDITIDPLSAEYIYDHVSSEKKKIVPFVSESHILVDDFEKQNVFDEILLFIKEHSADENSADND